MVYQQYNYKMIVDYNEMSYLIISFRVNISVQVNDP